MTPADLSRGGVSQTAAITQATPTVVNTSLGWAKRDWPRSGVLQFYREVQAWAKILRGRLAFRNVPQKWSNKIKIPNELQNALPENCSGTVDKRNLLSHAAL